MLIWKPGKGKMDAVFTSAYNPQSLLIITCIREK